MRNDRSGSAPSRGRFGTRLGWCGLAVMSWWAVSALAAAIPAAEPVAVFHVGNSLTDQADPAPKKARSAKPARPAKPARSSKKAAAPAKEPAFAPVRDDPNLPRVLLIGDSISIGYTPAVREALAGKANVHRPATNCGPTIRGLTELDKWLGDGKWDVIHFNWGLHDLRKDVGEKHQVPIDQYEKNLGELVARLKKTGGRLIWCSTTPVPDGTGNRTRGDEVKYNVVARKIMEANGVAINDLYRFALPQLNKIQRPANVHFSQEGSKLLAGQVAAEIVKALEKRTE